MIPDLVELPERIARKLTVQPDGHWTWSGWHNSEGYPYVSFEGRDQPAYRAVWTLLRGRIPAGLELDHVCVTPTCCNPDHLEVVTHAENLRRMSERQTSCRRAGHDWSIPGFVRVRPNGYRYCGECARLDAKARYARLRSASSRSRAGAAT